MAQQQNTRHPDEDDQGFEFKTIFYIWTVSAKTDARQILRQFVGFLTVDSVLSRAMFSATAIVILSP